MQRLRIRFRRSAGVKFISHLDIIRLWQRALRRAGVAIAYSEGFSPHPRISLAAPLAVGVTSEAELMDVILTNWVSPHSFTAVVSRQLPRGVEIIQVYPLGLAVPALQAQIRFAEYRVEVATQKSREDIEDAIAHLLSLENLPWQHERDTGPHRYDLRALVSRLGIEGWEEGRCTLNMSLRCDNNGSGRPEQVCAALGFEQIPLSIHRTRLILQAS